MYLNFFSTLNSINPAWHQTTQILRYEIIKETENQEKRKPARLLDTSLFKIIRTSFINHADPQVLYVYINELIV